MDSKYELKELKVLGKNIASIRESKKLSLVEMATLLEYNRNSLSKLEYGEQDIRFNTLKKIAQKLDVSIPFLFSRNFIDYEELRENTYFNNENFIGIFSKNVYEVLKKDALIQATIGVDAETTNRILRGATQNPRVITLIKISEDINRSMNYLLTEHSMKEE